PGGADDPVMTEGYVPRAPWRRRRTTDSPRPAGRRWAGRLRRSGSFARQVLLVRVGRRRRELGVSEGYRGVPRGDLTLPVRPADDLSFGALTPATPAVTT